MTPAREAQIQEAVLQAAKRVTTALEPGGK
jgi:hypothetical protein